MAMRPRSAPQVSRPCAPPRAAATALESDATIVADDFLERLNLHVTAHIAAAISQTSAVQVSMNAKFAHGRGSLQLAETLTGATQQPSRSMSIYLVIADTTLGTQSQRTATWLCISPPPHVPRPYTSTPIHTSAGPSKLLTSCLCAAPPALCWVATSCARAAAAGVVPEAPEVSSDGFERCACSNSAACSAAEAGDSVHQW